MDDLISEFITETGESIAVLDQELVKLEQNPEDEQILGNIFRLMHTIKGTCGFLGLPRLEHVAHASENVLGKVRDKSMTVTQEAVSLILESLDSIKAIMEYLSENGSEPEGDDADLIARLNQCANGGVAVSASAPSAEEAMEAAIAAYEAAQAATAAAAVATGNTEIPKTEAAKPAPAAAAPAPAAAVPATPAAPPAPPPKRAVAEGDGAPGVGGGEGGGALANQSIRVNLDVLEKLMQMVSELVLTRNQLMQIARTRQDKDFLVPLQQLSLITTELQEDIMKTRMQPIGNAWAKFPRLIRDLSMELGKKIDLRMNGADTELDRQLLEMVKDPLTHMVRNSCDHGLEGPADRLAAGKSEVGSVTLSAYHEGGHIIVEIADDGRGIHVDKIRAKIVEKNLASEAELNSMTEQQIIQYIFRPGFSTAEKVTSVSGRGVGMDVVRTNIEKMGGTVELTSTFGKGSTFHIKIPLTLAIVSVLIVEAGGERFGMPQINVLELVRCGNGSSHTIETIHDTPVLRLRDRLLPLVSLSKILQLDEEKPAANGETYIIVCRVGGNDFGVIVDRIYDTEEIVVKPVSNLLHSISIYSGNTVLGDGSVVMILDPNGLARATGELDARAHDESAARRTPGEEASKDRVVNFLLFRAGSGAPKAVPLELVSRLEEIDTTNIEWSGEHPVVQYRGELMQLVTLNDSYTIPENTIADVVVFSYDGKIVGLVVQEVHDIVEAPLTVKLSNKDAGYLGSMVIAGKTTDIVDVGCMLSGVIDSIVALNTVERSESASNYSLLLAEDSPFFRNLTVPVLLAVGYQVTAVEGGMEAFRLLGKQHFDLVVTDIEMPDMDGFDLLASCRAVPELADIPIIAFTSTLTAPLEERGRQEGFADMIVKTDREGLLQAIEAQLSAVKSVAA